MALFSKLQKRFKRKRRTNSAGFRDYRSEKAPLRKRRPVNPKVRKAIKAKTKPKSPKVIRLMRWLKVIAAALSFAVVFWFFFVSKTFDIQAVTVSSDSDFILEEKSAVTTYLQDYLGDNLFSFNTREHSALLLEEYSNLKSISIDRDLWHTLDVSLESYSDIANIQVSHEDGSKQYFIVNELGIISGAGTTNEYLPTVVMDVTGTDLDLQEGSEEETSPLSMGENLIEAEVIQTLLDVEKDFEGKFNMQIFEVHYLKRAREIHLYTERYFFVWLDLTQDVEEQLNKLKKSMTELNIYEAPLLYIDLRITGQNGEKVIYKLSVSEEN